MIRAHPPREFQPFVDAVDRDHHRRAAFLRDRARVHAEPAATLDHDAIAERRPSTRSSPITTCASAQFALTIIVSVTLSGTLKNAWPGCRYR